MSELYEIFNHIKELLYEKDFEKLDLPELVELILKENKTQKDYDTLKLIYEYIESMEKSLEDLGTVILFMSKFDEKISVLDLEKKVRDIILIIDRFIDGLAAFQRVIEFDESRLKLKQSLAYLKSLRSIIIKKTNEYKLKIRRTEFETKSFLQFIADTIDSFLREAYVIRILKIKQVIQKNIKQND